MFNSKANYKKFHDEIYDLVKRIIGDSDKTKNYLEYFDDVRKSVNIKTLLKILGYIICALIEGVVNHIRKINDGKSNWKAKCYEFCYKINKAVSYIDEYRAIVDFIACYCKHYTEEVLTIADFDDFTISAYYEKDIFENFFSSPELDIPLYFHYYTIAMVCIEIMNINGWFNSIEDIDKFLDNNNYYWYWYNDMKTAFNSREEDKGELLYKLTIIGLLLRTKREIESSQED